MGKIPARRAHEPASSSFSSRPRLMASHSSRTRRKASSPASVIRLQRFGLPPRSGAVSPSSEVARYRFGAPRRGSGHPSFQLVVQEPGDLPGPLAEPPGDEEGARGPTRLIDEQGPELRRGPHRPCHRGGSHPPVSKSLRALPAPGTGLPARLPGGMPIHPEVLGGGDGAGLRPAARLGSRVGPRRIRSR